MSDSTLSAVVLAAEFFLGRASGSVVVEEQDTS
jgi:hypothetical protein